ncbi:putative 54S ribosomal protein L22, mitochondrial [Mollisia scopiformis]|uniref:Putative 54S ribosomal protein L22, mitochondrial n=1 Tax=Mollisia scopiformis TaxID=149040 RepID=A0A194X6L5_MOLSC|nr:putative 54S ribosomal protein L22, mitochondrial [Mollisia scopiformis]KUJ15808.1 putative 54S ribosomal protein L22, mitochondrial [Mollisia scopiformis]
MSLHLPSRRVVRSATALINPQNPLSFLTPCIQKRTAFWDWSRRNELPDATRRPQNPLTEEYLKKKPKVQPPTRGDLAESSIFEDEEIAGPKPTAITKDEKGVEQKQLVRNPDAMAAALDPDPRGRQRWERKMVIREIHKRGRLTRVQQLKKEERVVLSKSHDFKTSVKKLMPLARQIAGKTVEEAIIQMRFSKKKVAKDVREHLEHAKNEAIVRRGMGLGIKDQDFTPVQIQTKDGKRVKVRDPTTLYVDQAWCGKGLFQQTPDHRARGNIFLMKNRTTSLSVVLKEEKTRIRLHEDRLKKEQKKKVWVQLPNRPITAQRQYYSW